MLLKFTYKKIIPSVSIFIGLIISVILIDYFLHIYKLSWLGRYTGIVGVVLILFSFLYSLRKRKYIKSGSLKMFLINHELLGWLGSLLIIVHGGIHFNSILPWAAMFAMLIVVASGITGKYLLKQSRDSLKDMQFELKSRQIPQEEIEKELFYSLWIVEKMQNWRKIHLPLTMIFTALALLHILIVIIFLKW